MIKCVHLDAVLIFFIEYKICAHIFYELLLLFFKENRIYHHYHFSCKVWQRGKLKVKQTLTNNSIGRLINKQQYWKTD